MDSILAMITWIPKTNKTKATANKWDNIRSQHFRQGKGLVDRITTQSMKQKKILPNYISDKYNLQNLYIHIYNKNIEPKKPPFYKSIAGQKKKQTY